MVRAKENDRVRKRRSRHRVTASTPAGQHPRTSLRAHQVQHRPRRCRNGEFARLGGVLVRGAGSAALWVYVGNDRRRSGRRYPEFGRNQKSHSARSGCHRTANQHRPARAHRWGAAGGERVYVPNQRCWTSPESFLDTPSFSGRPRSREPQPIRPRPTAPAVETRLSAAGSALSAPSSYLVCSGSGSSQDNSSPAAGLPVVWCCTNALFAVNK